MGLGGTGKGGEKGWVGGRIGMKWLRIRKGTEKRDGKKSGTLLRQCCSSSFCITHHWKKNLSVYILEIQNICVPPTQKASNTWVMNYDRVHNISILREIYLNMTWCYTSFLLNTSTSPFGLQSEKIPNIKKTLHCLCNIYLFFLFVFGNLCVGR